jgi:DNA-binding NarL/FixJ family response regulator
MPPDTSQLTRREQQVLVHLLTGISEKQIACQLELSPGTVHKYVTQIYRHYCVSTRPELMAMWITTVSENQFHRPVTID